MKRHVAMLIAVAVLGPAAAAESPAPSAFLAALAASRPEIRWDAKSLVAGDFDGDGKLDLAAVGYSSDLVVLAVVVSSAPKTVRPQFLDFAVGAGVQAAICSVPAELSTTQLYCDANGQALPGCRKTPKALGLSLADGNCDPINFYWDHDKRHLAWWRN